ncbi:unknown protein [Seminavis robusta]|uniref:Uncharacterized protein n=1 Tax=Seminavis robusta TaxID=568900 RepID=A0A9N8F110_9STRA|nr:unknown protein [Seminavis robusta]|eukprot:Sro3097_g343650.1 n/a (212) ;mRNA; f:3925-4560
MFYYRAVEADMVKPESKKVVPGNSGQRTIESRMKFVAPPTSTQKKQKMALDDMERMRRKLQSREEHLKSDIRLRDLLDKKSNRNNLGQPLRGLGRTKLEYLIGIGVTTVKELRDYDGGDKSVLSNWKELTREYYKGVKDEVEMLYSQLKIMPFWLWQKRLRMRRPKELIQETNATMTKQTTLTKLLKLRTQHFRICWTRSSTMHDAHPSRS